MLFGFLIATAFAIDIAQMHLSRAELRAATDAAANAAATTLADTSDQSQAILRGQQIAAANRVNSEPLLLASSDFHFGHSEKQSNGKYAFVEATKSVNSVRVDGARTTGSRSGAVPLFFGNVTGTHFFEPKISATATYIERDITLVVDRSHSMSGTKIRDLRNSVAEFISLLQRSEEEAYVGLASYNHGASQDVELTSDLREITGAMSRLRPSGNTSISLGIRAGRKIAERGRDAQEVEHTMILMTDGLHNSGPDLFGEARKVASDGVKIHTITFGGGADIVNMQEVAKIGNGRHYHADNAAQLIEVYRKIALSLGTMLTK